MMKTHSGITLIELLITIGIISILLTIGFIITSRYVARQQLREAQQVFIYELNQMRSLSRRTSLNYRLTWNTGVGDLTITRFFGATGQSPRTFTLPYGVRFTVPTSPSTFLQFNAPYGTLAAADWTFELISPRFSDYKSRINVIGVTGKVVPIERYF